MLPFHLYFQSFFFFAWKDTKSHSQTCGAIAFAYNSVNVVLESDPQRYGAQAFARRAAVITSELLKLSQTLFFVCLTGEALSFIYSWIPEVTDSYSHEYKEEPKTVGQIGEICLFNLTGILMSLLSQVDLLPFYNKLVYFALYWNMWQISCEIILWHSHILCWTLLLCLLLPALNIWHHSR